MDQTLLAPTQASIARTTYWAERDLEYRRKILRNANIGAQVAGCVRRIHRNLAQLAADRARLAEFVELFPELVEKHTETHWTVEDADWFAEPFIEEPHLG